MFVPIICRFFALGSSSLWASSLPQPLFQESLLNTILIDPTLFDDIKPVDLSPFKKKSSFYDLIWVDNKISETNITSPTDPLVKKKTLQLLRFVKKNKQILANELYDASQNKKRPSMGWPSYVENAVKNYHGSLLYFIAKDPDISHIVLDHFVQLANKNPSSAHATVQCLERSHLWPTKRYPQWLVIQWKHKLIEVTAPYLTHIETSATPSSKKPAGYGPSFMDTLNLSNQEAP